MMDEKCTASQKGVRDGLFKMSDDGSGYFRRFFSAHTNIQVPPRTSDKAEIQALELIELFCGSIVICFARSVG
eukprot:scaffold32061_cov171-Skeletonema_menzelii.AAC.2